MKGNDALQKAYDKQKRQFEEAKATRISNRKKQLNDIQLKIMSLENLKRELHRLNENEKDFESFESFRLKAAEQSSKQKSSKDNI
jgi:hypothetical protein